MRFDEVARQRDKALQDLKTKEEELQEKQRQIDETADQVN